MTKDEALKMALEALEKYCTPYQDGAHPADKTITAIKEALAQPEQKPEHVTYAGNGTAGFLEGERPTGFFIQADRRQPEQEPVACKLVPIKPTEEMLKAMDECSTEGYDERLYAGHAASVYMAAVDAAPISPQRTWFELTDEEIEAAIPFKDLSGEYYYDDVLNIILFIQAKLKRKNAEKN